MQLKNTVKSKIESSGDKKREKRRLSAMARMAVVRKSVFTIMNTVLMFSRSLLLMKKIVKLEILQQILHVKIMPKDCQKNYHILFYKFKVYQAYMELNIK